MDKEHLRDVELTIVLRTTEPGLLPLAEMALEEQHIEYLRRASAADGMMAGGSAYRGTPANQPFEILVRTEDAPRARDLLRDLEEASKPSSPR